VITLETREKLTKLIVLPFLKCSHLDAARELGHILNDKARHPITYNHYFTDNIQKIQQDRLTHYLLENTHASMVTIAQKTFTPGIGHEEKEYIDPVALKRRLQQPIQHDMNKFAAEQALDAHDAFYKVIFYLCYPPLDYC